MLIRLTQVEMRLNSDGSMVAMQDDTGTIRFDTSLVSLFLNRCHLSFKQMMFENLGQLRNSLNKYIRGQMEYEYPHAPMLFEKWIQDKATQIETGTIASSPQE